MKAPKIGEHAKVYLPGESPWAECVEILPDGTWIGRIDNTLFAESQKLREDFARQEGQPEALPSLHNFKKDDLVTFTLERGDNWECWVPAEPAGGRA